MTLVKTYFLSACRLAALCLVPLFFSGCMWGRVKVNDSSVQQRAERIRPGSTRLSQIPAILGAQPTIRIPGKKKTIYGYTFSDTKNHGLMLIFVNFMRSTTITQTLYVEGDSDTGIVTAVHNPDPREIEWKYWPFTEE